jgi:hypothetical protein
MACIQAMRGGKDYDASFGTRGHGTGLWADVFRQRFQRACRQLGFNREDWHLRTENFRAPSLDGQASLF